MAYILSIETATTNCSVSLSYKGETLFLKEDYGQNYSHAERLHVYIEELLTEAKIDKNQLDAIAVSKGPGSYTGLRIGVSTAKGLCYALDIPLIAVATLEHLAHQVSIEEGLIIPMLDARRMEVYTATFNHQFELLETTIAKVLDENSFQNLLDEHQVYFIGNGTSKLAEICKHQNAHFIHDKLPSAQQMSALAYQYFEEAQFEDVAYFEPYYLKDFIVLTKKK
ncbi:MAG: tRNA (adenosine(37)-N6)-threonylcarbamoyltransferase complex dimerization subunit type 1 TsaB [bacterium]